MGFVEAICRLGGQREVGKVMCRFWVLEFVSYIHSEDSRGRQTNSWTLFSSASRSSSCRFRFKDFDNFLFGWTGREPFSGTRTEGMRWCFFVGGEGTGKEKIQDQLKIPAARIKLAPTPPPRHSRDTSDISQHAFRTTRHWPTRLRKVDVLQCVNSST